MSLVTKQRIKFFMRHLLGVFFVFAGINHFLKPDMYVALMPPFLPAPLFLVYASGVAEIVSGALLFIPRFARLGAWGVFATLIAVYPANIYHAVVGGISDPALPETFANPAMAWGRLPIQFVLLAWAWWHTTPEKK